MNKDGQIMSRMNQLGLAALASMFVVPTTWGHVIEAHSIIQYEVNQTPGVTLLEAINRVSPIKEGGAVYHGFTKWNVNWNYQWKAEANGQCRITSVMTSLSTTTTLPKLVTSPQRDRAEFEQYIRALIRHEDGHKQFGRNAAQEVDQSILRAAAAPNCKLLEAQVNRQGMAIVEQAHQAEIEYDRTTQHGCSQGACLSR